MKKSFETDVLRSKSTVQNKPRTQPSPNRKQGDVKNDRDNDVSTHAIENRSRVHEHRTAREPYRINDKNNEFRLEMTKEVLELSSELKSKERRKYVGRNFDPLFHEKRAMRYLNGETSRDPTSYIRCGYSSENNESHQTKRSSEFRHEYVGRNDDRYKNNTRINDYNENRHHHRNYETSPKHPFEQRHSFDHYEPDRRDDEFKNERPSHSKSFHQSKRPYFDDRKRNESPQPEKKKTITTTMMTSYCDHYEPKQQRQSSRDAQSRKNNSTLSVDDSLKNSKKSLKRMASSERSNENVKKFKKSDDKDSENTFETEVDDNIPITIIVKDYEEEDELSSVSENDV